MTEQSAARSVFPLSVDLERVWRLAAANLRPLHELMEESPVPLEFDQSEYFIEWVACFLPLGLDRHFEDMLQKTVCGLKRRNDFHTHGWSRVLAIEAALYALTHDEDCLENVLGNLSHLNSQERRHASALLALVADRLPFDQDRFTTAVRENFERGHELIDVAALAAVTEGTASKKRQLLGGWCRETPERPNSPVAQLASGQAIPNPFFAKLAEVNRNAMAQLASRVPGEPELPGGWGSLKERLENPSDSEGWGIVAAVSLKHALADHPLMQPTVRVVDRVEEEDDEEG